LKTIWEKEAPVTKREVTEKVGLTSRSTGVHLFALGKMELVGKSEDIYRITERGKEAIGFPLINEETAKNILRETPREGSFHFYTEIDRPLGVS
jgi:DNA-binding transcriptional ArsR family regulator